MEHANNSPFTRGPKLRLGAGGFRNSVSHPQTAAKRSFSRCAFPIGVWERGSKSLRSFVSPKVLLLSLVLLGLLLRTYHYLRDPAVWHDEAAVIVNILSLDFDQLLGLLRQTQAAPPLFLWLEKATLLAFGDSTLELRLPVFFATLPTIFLVAWVARREAGPWAAVVATALITGSDRLLWHACEVKPYSFDVFCTAGLLAAFSATARAQVATGFSGARATRRR